MDFTALRRTLKDLRNKVEDERLVGALNSLELIVKDEEFQDTLPQAYKNYLQNLANDPSGYLQNISDAEQFQLMRYYFWSYLNNKKRLSADFATKLTALETKIDDAQMHLDMIEKTAGEINGATALSAYAEKFDKSARDHRVSANAWKNKIYIATFAFLVVFVAALFVNIAEFKVLNEHLAADIKLNASILAIVIKLALLVGIAQMIRFFSKNYYAEMHLEQTAVHRRNTLQSLHAVYIAISDQTEKDAIIKIGAAAAFQPGESGYITTKEGAGGNEDIAAALLSRLGK